ncbi:hypothetical protein F4779DRAFT_622339 [Xylariaceae sp. FL0662B]|nr:hypothetical protein F4779DRAFT_622339 [Xylariaceae sp. FL0662B]
MNEDEEDEGDDDDDHDDHDHDDDDNDVIRIEREQQSVLELVTGATPAKPRDTRNASNRRRAVLGTACGGDLRRCSRRERQAVGRHRVGIPDTAKPGDVFNATVERLAGIPLQYAVTFGIERYEEEWSVAPSGPGSLGFALLNTIDLQRLRSPYLNIIYLHGPAAFQAVVLAIAGPLSSSERET